MNRKHEMSVQATIELHTGVCVHVWIEDRKLIYDRPASWERSMANKPLIGCAIEAEPRTLTGGQLISAWKAAKGVAETKEAGEASAVFTEGMRPVVSIKTMEKQIERRDQLLHHLAGINSSPTDQVKQWTTTTLPAAGSTNSLE